MKLKTKNPHAVALGRKGGSKATDAQKSAARVNGKKGGRPKAAKLYPSVYADAPHGTIFSVNGFHAQTEEKFYVEETKPRKHTRTEVKVGQGE